MSRLSSRRRALGAVGLVLVLALGPLVAGPAVAAPPGCDPLVEDCDGGGPVCSLWNQVPPTISSGGQTGRYVGEYLTADSGSWTAEPTQLTYRWLRGGSQISGATSSTYRLQPGDMGALVTVRVTASNPQCEPSSDNATAVPRGPILESPDLGFTEFPSIVWSGIFGHQMSMYPGAWTSAEVPTFTYVWFRDEVASANQVGTGQTYSPQEADLGHTIIGRVHAATPGYTPKTAATTSRNVVEGSPTTYEVTPVVLGDRRVGTTMSVLDGRWFDAPYWRITYAWTRNGATIEGATDDEYTLKAIDLETQVAARLHLTRTGYASRTFTTAAVPVTTGPAPVVETAPVLEGTGGVDSLLTVTPARWVAPGPATVSYQWLLDGEPLPGATSTTLRVEQRDLGAAIAVRVTGEREGHESTVITTSAKRVVVGKAPTATTKPFVSGTRKFGKTLTVDTGVWDMASTFAYPWCRGGAKVAGAVGTSYPLGAADFGKVIEVEAHARANGHAVGHAKIATGKIAYTGTLKYSKEKIEVKGEAKATCRLTKADRRKKISVRVTGAKSGYVTGVVRSKPVEARR